MKVGEALITCPGCGAAFTCSVYLDRIEQPYSGRLLMQFKRTAVEHECPGRDG